jgi:hypothetical protein
MFVLISLSFSLLIEFTLRSTARTLSSSHEELILIVEIVGRELSPYKIHSTRNTVIEFVIHDDGQGEVKLSPGLGSFIPERRKQAIFQHSKEIADLCVEVMNRRSAEAVDLE